MTPVILESPFAGNRARNARYLALAIRDCITRGESPYASHAILTLALDDDNAAERARGIAAGFAWRRLATRTVFYVDLGWSMGMRQGLEHCKAIGGAWEERRIEGWRE